jgi:type I restriction enzyme S subunit
MSSSASIWQSRPLSELATTTSGGTSSRNRKDYFGEIIPWIKSSELNDNYIDKAEENFT